MSFRSKILLASMIVRGVATFGLALYALVHFAGWVIEDSGMDLEQ